VVQRSSARTLDRGGIGLVSLRRLQYFQKSHQIRVGGDNFGLITRLLVEGAPISDFACLFLRWWHYMSDLSPKCAWPFRSISRIRSQGQISLTRVQPEFLNKAV
jgi:hypothetical protein